MSNNHSSEFYNRCKGWWEYKVQYGHLFPQPYKIPIPERMERIFANSSHPPADYSLYYGDCLRNNAMPPMPPPVPEPPTAKPNQYRGNAFQQGFQAGAVTGSFSAGAKEGAKVGAKLAGNILLNGLANIFRR